METINQTKTSLQLYSELIILRDALKPFTQVSWTIKNLERKADIDSIDECDYEAVLKLYQSLENDIDEAYNKMKQILKTNKTKTNETNNQIHKN